jgi:hypothetical protein
MGHRLSRTVAAFIQKKKNPGLIGNNVPKTRENMKFGKTAYFYDPS